LQAHALLALIIRFPCRNPHERNQRQADALLAIDLEKWSCVIELLLWTWSKFCNKVMWGICRCSWRKHAELYKILIILFLFTTSWTSFIITVSFCCWVYSYDFTVISIFLLHVSSFSCLVQLWCFDVSVSHYVHTSAKTRSLRQTRHSRCNGNKCEDRFCLPKTEYSSSAKIYIICGRSILTISKLNWTSLCWRLVGKTSPSYSYADIA
jgi:hypothetical protein